MSRTRLRALGAARPHRSPRTLVAAVAALAIAAASLAVAPGAQAQELGPDDVIIETVYPTTIAGLEDLVFDVTRGSAPEEDLVVLVTLSSGILSALEQTLPVLIPANSRTTRLAVSTRILMDGATTGDVTATVGDGDDHDVGEPSTATVRVYVGGGVVAVQVGFSAPVYRLDESVGTTTDQIRLTATTKPGSPVPRSLTVPVWTRDDTATSGDDYSGLSGTVTFRAPWTAEETPDGDVYSSAVSVPVSIVDDDGSEGEETFTLWVGFPAESPNTVSLVSTDSAPECDSSGCGSYVIITDNEDGGTIILDEDSGDVTISAVHATALQGIDDLVFSVTRSVASENDLDVPVTLSPGIIDEDRLSHTVTIGANETSAELRVHTRILDPDAATGDVTATLGDGDMHDVGEPSSATVRVYVGAPLVTVRLNAGAYTLDESVGTTTDEISVIAETAEGVPAPNFGFDLAFSTRPDTATAPHDYPAVSQQISLAGASTGTWTADANRFVSEVAVPLTIIDDDDNEGAEVLRVLLERTPQLPASVGFEAANEAADPCTGSLCESTVTIVDDDNRGVTLNHAKLAVDEGNTAVYTVVLDRKPVGDVTITPDVQSTRNADISASGPLTFTPQDWSTPKPVTVTAVADDNRLHGSATVVHTVTGADYEENGVTAASVAVTEWDAEGRTVVTLVHVPDGTVIPDNSSLTVGETVQDGTTFTEGERVLFRLQFAAADGGPPVGGADVELTAWWSRESSLVPTSGHISRVEFSLPRVTQWDTAIQILDNDVGNPDGTATIRITGCKRNGCEIGEPSEITVTIADDDGGPETAPPGKPDAPRLVCASSGDGYDSTGIAVNWQAPTFEGGAAIDGYEVQYRRRIGAGNPWVWGGWQAWPHNGTATSTSITGLDVETLYGVQVRAFNANGPGQWSLPNTFGTGQPDQICEILDRFTP